MILPDTIVATIGLKDQYFDLEGLSTYSALKVPTLREYIKERKLPAFKVLIRKSEFDSWLEKFRVKDRIEDIVNEVMGDLKSGVSKH